MKLLARISIALGLCTQIIFAETENPDAWFKNYYRNPEPVKVPEAINFLVESGALQDPQTHAPIVGFTSQVMADNPGMIADWMTEWSALPSEALFPIYTALWFSRTPQAKLYFQEQGLAEYLQSDAPDILGMNADSPGTLNLLWGYFFATGEKAPIESLVTALSLGQYSGALAAFEDSEKSEEDRKAAYLDATFQTALASLELNAADHPLVKQYCEEILAEGNLTQREKLWLEVALSRVEQSVSESPIQTAPENLPQD